MKKAALTKLKIQPIKPYLLWLVWLIWLPFLTPNFVTLFGDPTPLAQVVFSLVTVLLFFLIYLLATWDTVVLFVSPEPQPLSTHTPRVVWLAIGGLSGLAASLVLVDGKDWFVMFYYVAGYVAGRLPTLRAIKTLTGLALLIIVLGLVKEAGWYFTGQAVLYVGAIGTITVSIVSAVATSRKLRLAQAEVARLAVANERLRIARDLHDLLGHNLSLIALKSELAGRLLKISSSSERAVAEIGDVEQVARATLNEVREAVSNYRQPTLTYELKGAAEVLAAAGIVYHCEINPALADSLPGPVEAVLAWTVREGITNVVRHTQSKECRLRIVQQDRQVVVEIVNSAGKPTSPASSTPGNGLRGLSERLAAVEGGCEAGFDPEGNFRLRVWVPETQPKEQSA